jgi:hypothetical protein
MEIGEGEGSYSGCFWGRAGNPVQRKSKPEGMKVRRVLYSFGGRSVEYNSTRASRMAFILLVMLLLLLLLVLAFEHGCLLETVVAAEAVCLMGCDSLRSGSGSNRP